MRAAALMVLLGAGCASTAVGPPRAPSRLPPPPRTPALAAVGTFRPPVISRFTLANGLPVIAVEKPGDAMETVAWVTRIGSSEDGVHPGLAKLVGEVLVGARGHPDQPSSEVLAQALGASWDVSTAHHGQRLALTVLAKDTVRAIALISTTMQPAPLEEATVERTRARQLARLQARANDPELLASDGLAAALFEAPDALPPDGTVEGVGGLSVNDLRDAVARIGARNSILICVGGRSSQSIREAAERELATVRDGVLPAVRKPKVRPPSVVVIDRPGATQSVVRAGTSFPEEETDNARFGVHLLNELVGGSFGTTRLMKVLREQKRYTYGVSSALESEHGRSIWTVATDVDTASTADAMASISAELERAGTEALTADEVALGRALFAMDELSSLQSSESLLRKLSDRWLSGAAEDWTWRALAAPVPAPAEVREAFRRAVNPAHISWVIVGDRARIEDGLREAGFLFGPAPRREPAVASPSRARPQTPKGR